MMIIIIIIIIIIDSYTLYSMQIVNSLTFTLIIVTNNKTLQSSTLRQNSKERIFYYWRRN